MQTPDKRHEIIATIWEHIEPYDREDRYEEKLDTALNGRGEVVGGGSHFNSTSGIQFVNIEIEVDTLDLVDLVKETLEANGVPRGSELRFSVEKVEKVIEFGVTECVALVVDGVNLPDEVYEAANVDEIADRLTAALNGVGEIRTQF